MNRAVKLTFAVIWNIFAAIGVAVVAGGLYLWFVDPLNLKPVLWPATDAADAPRPPTPNSAASQLTPQQQAAANSLGLDANAVATLLNPATEACAVAALGQTRVNEIKAGAAPTAVDIYAARSCLIR